ncbi:MAG: phosphoglyceromutase, partial [Candidatus Pelagibacter sp. TMED128]
MSKLILTRHGQSIWNAENRFTGWVDVDLSEEGVLEAKKSGQLIKSLNINIDVSYTSFLKRAIKTLTTILQENELELKFNTSWELNERHYGSLTGLNKEETKNKIGEEQFKKYRRSWDIPPPPMAEDDKNRSLFSPLNPSIPLGMIPFSESLKDTYERVIPYYEKEIQKHIKENKNVLISAHGNSLRALCKYLFNISDQ